MMVEGGRQRWKVEGERWKAEGKGKVKGGR